METTLLRQLNNDTYQLAFLMQQHDPGDFRFGIPTEGMLNHANPSVFKDIRDMTYEAGVSFNYIRSKAHAAVERESDDLRAAIEDIPMNQPDRTKFHVVRAGFVRVFFAPPPVDGTRADLPVPDTADFRIDENGPAFYDDIWLDPDEYGIPGALM